MKKLLTAILVAVMVVSSVLPVAAQENASLPEAIKLAKSLFSTDSFTQFWSHQETYNGRTTYQLYWSEENGVDKSPAHLTVRVDAQRLLITGYNYQPAYQEQAYPPLPKMGENECLTVAEAFAAKLAPEHFAQMKLEKVDKPQIRIEKRSGPLSYIFRYVHYINGIAFQPNNMHVSVNGDTGEIQDYYLTWEDYEFPSTEGTLTLADAQEVFKTKGLKLVYSRRYSWREQTNKPYLAYTLENGSAMQIDAVTGEITYGGYRVYNTSLTKDMPAVMGLSREQAFTPWELEEIDTVAGLLTVEQGEAIAREIISLSEKAQLRSSRLMEDKSENLRFWNLEWEYMIEDYYVGASARLNAADGEIQNFHFWEKTSPQEGEPKLTYEEALAVASEFLQKWLPAKYEDTELTSRYKHQDGQRLPHTYSFTFERRINGLPVVGDSMNVNVQYDKRVTSFYSNWYNGEFPSAEGALTVEEMNDIFLQNVGLKIEYVHHFDSASSSEFNVYSSARYAQPTIKLVYKANELNSYSFNPVTGKSMDYYGKDIVPVTKPEYNDIAGHWAQAAIVRLVDLGLLRLEGSEFRPDEAIKLGDLLMMLSDASGDQNSEPILPLWLKKHNTSNYADALWYGVARGIIREKDKDIDPETLVTREVLAFYLARMQGYSEATSLKGIWTAPYSDFALVSTERQGSVSIVHALGLMGSGGNGQFLPKQEATRAQVAVILSRMLDKTN
ncbi:MAG: propeptide PepSY amd peptidase M4 [Bacillota bacterium]|nr:MAG: propeptide PepSY amd peptidase M4 [Bacillota bacterium]